MLFVVLCPGTPEGSSGSGSGFKVIIFSFNFILPKININI